jgi:hypothetical protein
LTHLGNILAGYTSPGNDIEYNGDLYGNQGHSIPAGQEGDFLQTIAHEMLHVQASLLDKSVTNFGDIHETIDNTAWIIYGQSKDYYKKSIESCICGKNE